MTQDEIVTEAMKRLGAQAIRDWQPCFRGWDMADLGCAAAAIYTAMSTAQEPAAMTCGDCGWQGPEAVWRAECKGFPCELKARSTAPALDDDAEWLRTIGDPGLTHRFDNAQRARLERIAARLQAKAPETDNRWRCLNCKEVWSGVEMPDRCGTCCCSSFASVAP